MQLRLFQDWFPTDSTGLRDTQMRTLIDYGDDWFSLTGPQLHSAELVRMECMYRRDGGPTRFIFLGSQIEANVASLRDTDERGLTTLGNDRLRIRQVEHVLSALFAMSCLDTDVSLKYVNDTVREKTIAPPVAHLDARDLTLAIRRSFMNRPQPRPVEFEKALIIHEDSSERDGSFAVIAPYSNLHVTVHVNFPVFWGKQVVSLDVSPFNYEREICWARSFFGSPFPHKTEWPELKSRFPGVIREREEHFRSCLLDYDHQKWITPIFTEDEPARHKLLDFLGDLALLGTYPNASIYVYKPHHRFNRFCVAKLHSYLFM